MDFQQASCIIITVFIMIVLTYYNNNNPEFFNNINGTWHSHVNKLFKKTTDHVKNLHKTNIFGEPVNGTEDNKQSKTTVDLDSIDETKTKMGPSFTPDATTTSNVKPNVIPTTTKPFTVDAEEEIIYESKTTANLINLVNSTTVMHSNATSNVYYATFSYNPSMGLGNCMFLYASAYGIAKKHHKTFVIRKKPFYLNEVFSITTPYMNTTGLDLYHKGYGHCCKYSTKFDDLPADRHVKIGGYLQSYKYFIDYEREIRAEFTFLPEIRELCTMTIMDIMQKATNISNNRTTGRCQLVGAHMRRGDFVSADKQKHGHHPATKEFLHAAIDHFRAAFEGQCLLFVILGNDYRWNNENAPNSSDVLVLKPQSAGVDMCILSNCDHNIVSAGSFGWWTAWLGNGYTVYDKVQVRPGSKMQLKSFNANYSDYIPEKWVPV